MLTGTVASPAMMSRRRWLMLSATGLVAGPVAALAQPGAKIPRVGYLLQPPLGDTPSPERQAFLDGLRTLGYVEGRTVQIEYRSAGGNAELLEDLAEELVRAKVDVIVTAGGNPSAHAARQATSTIPIVMATSSDAVETGLVASLARPGGNVTGLTRSRELAAKRLQLLKEAFPKMGRVAVLWSPNVTAKLEWNTTTVAARNLGVFLQSLEINTGDELLKAFDTMTKRLPDGLVMFFDPETTGYRQLVADFAKKHRLPSMFGWKDFVLAGGLMSYAADTREMFRRAATYVDRILKGARPGDLPIEQPTRFELVINLLTAKAIGATIPPALLLQADQIID
jgi:putative ABC transport system substrate-binding protein